MHREDKQQSGFGYSIERIIPGATLEQEPIYQKMLAMYEWAKQFVMRKMVLEAGCGEGYGAAIMASVAKEIVAVDIEPSIVKHAPDKYRMRNLTFLVADLQAVPFQSNSFDTVVSYEVIEHLYSYSIFLNSLQRVLKPRGLLVLSTPNKKLRTTKDGRPMNPYHVREFMPDEFHKLLADHFPNVKLLGVYGNAKAQAYELARLHPPLTVIDRALSMAILVDRLGLRRVLPIRLKKRVEDMLHCASTKLRRSKEGYIDPTSTTANDYSVGEGDLDECINLIAICSM